MFRLRIIGDVGFEFWKDIPDYEELYQASTYGRIKSIERVVARSDGRIRVFPSVILKQVSLNGYLGVTLHKKGDRKLCSVHKLIALTFLPKWKKEYSQVNHKSEVKTENQVWNLEFCTPQYNTNYGTGIQRSAKQKHKPICQYDMKGCLIKRFPSLTSAQNETGISLKQISKCLIGSRKTTGGFIWKYA